MLKLRIQGGRKLKGKVTISGAKNAALPALAACILTEKPVHLLNLPTVWDTRTMLKLLFHIGAESAKLENGSSSIQIKEIQSSEAPYELVKTMRASILALGPLVARNGYAKVSLPGGCAIGERPVNFHLDGLKKLGAKVEIKSGYIEVKCKKLKGGEFTFERKSVTGTENLMMAASLAEGTTHLINCAKEPEVMDLSLLLNAMGAKISGAGTDKITIEGVKALKGAKHKVISDRIEAGSYIIAAVAAGKDVEITNINPDHLTSLLSKLEEVGVKFKVRKSSILVQNQGSLKARDMSTSPYPGFPTDMQAQYMTLMTRAVGASIITETIFEKRFMHVAELCRMGADIKIKGRNAVVKGPTPLKGVQVMATDLRASASLVIAALIAEGETVIDRVYHLKRGYENLEEKLRALGAEIETIS